MLYNLIFSLNIVMPLVILAAVGYGAKRVGLITDAFLAGGNKVLLYMAIPSALFSSLYGADLREVFDPVFIAFVAIWTVISFAIIWVVTYMALRKHHAIAISAIVNGAHRGNLTMLGLPLLLSILGDSDDASKIALAVAVIIPLYNIQTLLLLTIHSSTPKKLDTGSLLLGITKNPPIISAALGITAAITGLALPVMAERAIAGLASLASPLALICLGGAMYFKGFDAKVRFALASSLIKVVVLPIITITIATLLGFRGNDLTILAILHGTPAAVAAYVMITEHGGDTYIAGTNVMLTTILSAFTLSILIFALRTFGIIA